MVDLDTNKSTQRGSLEPLNMGGTLHVTHTAQESDAQLILTPSRSSKLAYTSCLFFGAGILIASVYTLFAVVDVFAACALFIGGGTLIWLGGVVKKGSKEYRFIQSEKKLIGLEKTIPFKEIAEVELLKKIVNAKRQEEPFQSGEIRILTNQGTRYLLAEGANRTQMKKIATLIAEYINVPLVSDETLYRV